MKSKYLGQKTYFHSAALFCCFSATVQVLKSGSAEAKIWQTKVPESKTTALDT
jgi:hypothetical protein